MEKFRNTNTGIDRFVKNNEEATLARFGHINAIVDVVTALQNTPPGSGIASVQAGTDISVDNTDPLNPIVNSTVVYSSGAFTPTVTNETPNTTSINMNGGFYQRVDSIVTMSFFFEINFGVSDSSVTFNIDLPIASDFTNIKDIVGVFTPNDYIDFNGGQIVANTSSNLGEITVNGTAGSTITYVWAMVQYEVK